MSKILITGGTGFVGRRLIGELEKSTKNYAYTYRGKPIAQLAERGLRIDLTKNSDFSAHRQELENVECVVHAAADVPEASKKRGYEADFETNIIQPLLVVKNLICNLPNLKRVVFVSSCYVNNHDLSIGFYGTGKELTEIALHKAAKLLNISSIVLRFPQIYGPQETHGVYPNRFIKMALNRETVELNKGAALQRDLLFIDDAVSAILMALELTGNETITVSSDETTSPLEVAKTINELIGLNYTGVQEQGDGEVLHFPSDYKKYGFELQYPLKDGLLKTIDYYRSENV